MSEEDRIGRPIPEATLGRVALEVARFRAERLSGSVTVVLHFLRGRDMPSDVGTHERQVGTAGHPSEQS